MRGSEHRGRWLFCGSEATGLDAGGRVVCAFARASSKRHSSPYLTTSLVQSWPMKKTTNRMALKGLRKPQANGAARLRQAARNSAAENR